MKLTTYTNISAKTPTTGPVAQLVCCKNPVQRFEVEVFAHFSNNIILVTMPQTPAAAYLVIKGKKFQIRVTVENVVYTFNTKVVKICQQPYICLRICNQDKLAITSDILHQLSA